jgi:hypothetical protein
MYYFLPVLLHNMFRPNWPSSAVQDDGVKQFAAMLPQVLFRKLHGKNITRHETFK